MSNNKSKVIKILICVFLFLLYALTFFSIFSKAETSTVRDVTEFKTMFDLNSDGEYILQNLSDENYQLLYDRVSTGYYQTCIVYTSKVYNGDELVRITDTMSFYKRVANKDDMIGKNGQPISRYPTIPVGDSQLEKHFSVYIEYSSSGAIIHNGGNVSEVYTLDYSQYDCYSTPNPTNVMVYNYGVESLEDVKINFTTNFGAIQGEGGSATAPIDCSYVFDNITNENLTINYTTNYNGYVSFIILNASDLEEPQNIANAVNGLFRNIVTEPNSVVLWFKTRLTQNAEFKGLLGKVGSIIYDDKTMSENYSKYYNVIPCKKGVPYTLNYPTSALSVKAGQKVALMVVAHPNNQAQFPQFFIDDLNNNNVPLLQYDGIILGGYYGFTFKQSVIATYDNAPYYPVDDDRIFNPDGSNVIDDKGGTGSDGQVISPNPSQSGGGLLGITNSAFDFIKNCIFVLPNDIQNIILIGLTLALTIGILRLVTG